MKKTDQKQHTKPKVKLNPVTANIRYMEFKQYQKLISQVSNLKYKYILRLAFESACRVTEICNLRLKDLDFKNSEIFIEPSLTKTGIGGNIEISPDLMNDLHGWLKSEGRIKTRTGEIIKPLSYLFESRNTRLIEGKKVKKYTRQRLNQIFNHYSKKAGLEKFYLTATNDKKFRQFSFHSLRHSSIMHSIHDLKLTLDTVRAKSRHTTLAGLSSYTKPSPKLVREDFRKAREDFEKTRGNK